MVCVLMRRSDFHLPALGMSAQQSLNRSHNDGDACATRSSSEYVRQKYLRIRRMKIRFDTGKSQKKLAADCSAQSSGDSVAKNSQMEVSRSAGYQEACGNPTDNLENETRNIHENISSFCFCIASAHHSGPVSLNRVPAFITACHSPHSNAPHGGSRKKPALRRQRILWRRRVGDASAKPTSAVKLFESCDFITVLCSVVPAFSPKQASAFIPFLSPAQSEDLFSSL